MKDIDVRIKNNYSYQAYMNTNPESPEPSEIGLYCSNCHQLNRIEDFVQFEDGVKVDKEEIEKKSNWVPYHCFLEKAANLQHTTFYHCAHNREILSEITKKLKHRTQTDVLKRCPNCGQIIKKTDIFYLEQSKHWKTINCFLYRYKITKEENKIILSAYLYSVYPAVKVKKVKYIDLNVRFVFNLDTNNVYAFQVYDVEKNKPLTKDSKRILNITYLSNSDNYLTPIHKTVLKHPKVQKSLMKVFNDIYKKNEQLTNYKDIILFFRYHELSKEARDIIKEITDISHICANTAQKRKVVLQDIYKMQSDRDYLLKIIKQKKCPQKKRFIKMSANNPFSIYSYKLLKNMGFTDYNVMLNIIDEQKNSSLILLFLDLLPEKSDSIYIKTLIKAFVQEKGDIYTKKNVFDCFNMPILKDTARMYVKIITNIEEAAFDEEDENEPINIKDYFNNIQKMHDDLSRLLIKLKFKNHKIPYYKKDLSLNMAIDDYSFLLAPNTHSLIDCGEKLGICVGGYGDYALRRADIIVFMMKNSKYIGCIELSSSGKELVQSKAKYNNLLQSEHAIALKKWIDANHINANKCADYQHILKNNIEYNGDLFPRQHNYAQVKVDNIDEINKNVHLNTNYYIIDDN